MADTPWDEHCGCCGRELEFKGAEWCNECKEHINPRKTLWDATYFAQHGVDCPFQITAKLGFGPTLGT